MNRVTSESVGPIGRIFFALIMLAFALPAAAQVNVAALRTQLLNATGETYIMARDLALGLPQSDFDDLLAMLELADPISQDRMIAAALRTRNEQPTVAAEFDQHLQDSIQNPGPGRNGKPIYRAWWPHDRLDLDPLAFEAILKLDWPSGGFVSLKQSFTDFMNRQNPGNVDRILYLTKTEGIGWACFLDDAAQSHPEEQIRITPILVQQHQYWREHGQISPAAVYVLASFGTQLQLDALNEIKAFEQQRLPVEGFTPWNDENYKEHCTATLVNLSHAEKALAAAQAQGQPQSALNTLSATVEQRRQETQTAERRLYAKNMWDRLEEAIAGLNAQLNPPPVP